VEEEPVLDSEVIASFVGNARVQGFVLLTDKEKLYSSRSVDGQIIPVFNKF